MSHALDRLLAQLDALAPDQRAGVLPLVIVMLGDKLGDRLPAPLRATADAFIDALGWQDGDSEEKKAASVTAWLAHCGVDAAVWRHLLAALPADVDGLRDAAAAIGGDARIAGALERKAPPPEGTVGAGPFARFQLRSK